MGSNIICRQEKFTTTLYLKHTFGGACSKFESFLRCVYKFGMVYTLVYKRFCICTDSTKFHAELSFLKKKFLKMIILKTLAS